MQAALGCLGENGYTLLIASAARDSILRMMEETGISPHIFDIISGQTVRENKPSPDIYLQAIALSGFSPEHCLAVEDSIYGIQAARRAGLELASVYSPLFPDVQAIGDHPLGTVSDLLPLLGLPPLNQ